MKLRVEEPSRDRIGSVVSPAGGDQDCPSTSPVGRTRGFTLIELLVVVSIIGLLIALLVPSFSAIRTKAKATATSAQFNALQSGITLYQSEQPLGGQLPPSASDASTGSTLIVDPGSTGGVAQPDVHAAGAHLLLFALLGADLRGTPGFRDFDRNGSWANDTHQGDKGAYQVDATTLEPLRPRYPASGGFVDDDLRSKRTRSLQELVDRGVILSWTDAPSMTPTKDLKLFVDSWELPILYYRASRAARFMIHDDDKPGIYRQEDNGLITGSVNGTLQNMKGIDFGGGTIPTRSYYSRIAKADAPAPNSDLQGDPTFDDTFARFIHNTSVTKLDRSAGSNVLLNEPVRKDSYLMISAGPDKIYGTSDDVVNWTRETDQ